MFSFDSAERSIQFHFYLRTKSAAGKTTNAH
jgi:hypothetical protein